MPHPQGRWNDMNAASMLYGLVRSAAPVQALDDGDAEGQSVFTAARSFCPAVLTSPRADTTPDTELTPGLARRLPAAVLSVFSALLSALVWAWNRPWALVTSVARGPSAL